MSGRVVSDVSRDGRLVARKRSRNAVDARRLRYEAEVLDAARHPGVVELVDCVGDDDEVELTTVFVGTHSLDTLPLVSIERAAGVVAALAETVADLHELGIAHGRIEPSHVLIGPGGRPVLCGFAGGGRIDTTPPPGSTATPGFCDPAATDGTALTPEVDVYGLGALLRTLILDEPHEPEPIPEHRLSVRRVRPRWSGYERRALLMLADQATDDAPLRRPSARRLASDISSAVPSAHFREEVDPYGGLRSSAHHEQGHRHRTRVAAFGAIAVGAVVAVVFGVTGTRDDGSAAASPPRLASSTTMTPSMSSPAIRVDSDGAIVVAGQRYTAGVPGDVVVQGDWDCDGARTLALLRPSTGAVYVFDAWATAGVDVSVAPTTVVVDAVGLDVQDDGQCSVLMVTGSDGSRQEVKL